MIKLSILICTIRERAAFFNALHTKITEAAAGYPVEILYDDTPRHNQGGITIGAKRQLLLERAAGEYIAYIDDDDDILPDYFPVIIEAIDKYKTDVICFNHEAWINGRKYIIDVNGDHQNEQLHDNGPVKRSPGVASVWRREAAIKSFFPDQNVSEDSEWAAGVPVRSFIKVDKVLHKYIYEDSKTAAVDTSKAGADKKRCIISFSSHGRENYNEKILRLIESVKAINYETDWLIYSPDHPLEEYMGVKINKGYPPGCDPHSVTPYHFKPKLFELARKMGYQQVLWCDSTIQVIRHPQTIMDFIGTNGIAVWDNPGHTLVHYINDTALHELRSQPNDLQGYGQIMACVIGIDFDHQHAKHIFDLWNGFAQSCFPDDETNRPGFRVHRHDQAVLSFLCCLYKVSFIPYGTLCYSPLHESGKYSTIFLNKN